MVDIDEAMLPNDEVDCGVWLDEAQGLGVEAGAVDQLKPVEVCGLVVDGALGTMPLVTGCSGFENCVAEGVRISNRFRSGVTVRNDWGFGVGAAVTGGLGVDHENCGGDMVETGGAAAGAAGASQPASIPLFVVWDFFPFTNRSKSSSVAPLAGSNVVPVTPPNAKKSSFGVAARPPSVTVESSCSFLVCSSSTRLESTLINSMKDWNCFRLRSGPKLIFQRIGRISIATKSASATSPTTRRTVRAAIMTAGSFVLIALIRGTIFSCIVYLSRALEFVFLFSGRNPSSPSSTPSREPPHRMVKACKPRTLIARLFVLLNTAAITGNSSFLMVLKSKTGRMDGSPRIATSTSEGAADSTAVKNIGRISIQQS